MGELKPGWARWRFDQIAHSVTERVDDPSKAGVEHYIGLEHLDSESLKIRRWGSPDDVSATKLLFEPGDIIFGRRRAYQRKLGVAEFRGIASAHSLVLRGKPSVVLPEFLPFFMRSDTFMERAVKISVGGLSPTINWRTLAKQEFALPSLEEQLRLSVALRSIEESFRSIQDARVAVDRTLKSFLVDTFRPDRGKVDVIPSHWKWERVENAGAAQLGQQRHPKFKTGSNVRPYLRVANVLDGWIDFSDVLEMHFPEKDLSKFELKAGDILLNEGQSTELVGRSAIYMGEVVGCCAQKTLVRFRCGPSLIPVFAHAYFQHCLYTGQFSRMVVQTTSMAHLTAVRFKAMRIPIAPLTEQSAFADTLGSLRGAQGELDLRLARIRHTRVAFMRSCLEATA